MLTREGGWVVCEMSTKVNKRWVHGSFMVNVDFQRIASSLFTWLKLKKFSSNDSNVISSKAQVSWLKKPLFRENFYTCFSMQSGSQSETDEALLVASPSWASKLALCWTFDTKLFPESSCIFCSQKQSSRGDFSGVFLCAFLVSPLVLLCPIEVTILEVLK